MDNPLSFCHLIRGLAIGVPHPINLSPVDYLLRSSRLYCLRLIDELAAPDMLLQYSLHAPRRGRQDVRNFMRDFRAAFPDLKFWGAADLIAEGDYVVRQWKGGGTHTGTAFCDLLAGALPAASGRKMH